jgi:tetratricopeptide (TPR) repeat protein
MSSLHGVLTGRGLASQLVRRADRARNRKAYAKAAKVYSLVLTLHPERSDLRVQLGQMLKEGGRYFDAEAAYRLALAQTPEDGVSTRASEYDQPSLQRPRLLPCPEEPKTSACSQATESLACIWQRRT